MRNVLLGPASDVPEGSMRRYTLSNLDVLVAHVGPHYYAIQAKCPHLGGDLSRGRLEGTIVTCPLHGSKFDVRDGSVVAWIERMPGLVKQAAKALKPPTAATTYSIREKDGNLYVELPD